MTRPMIAKILFPDMGIEFWHAFGGGSTPVIVKSVKDSNNNEYDLYSNGTLMISKGASGTGVMPNFGYNNSIRELIGENFTSVVIADDMTNVSNYAFHRCISMGSVTIPNSVTSIGNTAFWGCTSLTSVTIPDSVTSIGLSAFSGCTSLISVTIPNSVTSIGQSAFSGCISLTDISVSSDNPNYSSENGILFNKSKTELIRYPGGKIDISYTIPDTVVCIENSAVSWCTHITSVTIPSSVWIIETDAFYGCSALTSVTMCGANPPEIGFTIMPNNPTVIYVPASSVDAYKSAWSSYANQIQAAP